MNTHVAQLVGRSLDDPSPFEFKVIADAAAATGWAFFLGFLPFSATTGASPLSAASPPPGAPALASHASSASSAAEASFGPLPFFFFAISTRLLVRLTATADLTAGEGA